MERAAAATLTLGRTLGPISVAQTVSQRQCTTHTAGRTAQPSVSHLKRQQHRLRGGWRLRAGQPSSEPDEVDRPFLEPFVRSAILGLGSAVLLETAHVTLQAYGLAESAGLQDLAQALLTAKDTFAPLFLADHVAAIAGWVGFYVIEAVAIAAVLRNCAGDQAAATSALHDLVTLPKRMLPVRLQLFKHIFAQQHPAVATSAAAGAPTAAAAPLSSKTNEQPSLPAASAFVDASSSAGGSDVLQRHQRPATLPNYPRQQQAAPEIGAPPAGPSRKEGPTKGGSNIVPTGDKLAERRKGLKPGSWDAGASAYARRQHELHSRRSYLTNFWYAAALSEKVKAGEPHGVHMLGKQFVLFREEDGTVRCLDDVCPHRGAPLSDGWVKKIDGHDCVVCPYHGWAFDSSGTLRDVPAAEGVGEWPKRQIVPSFPVEEKGGFVWLFYGSKDLPADERPPIPYVPELDDTVWKPVYGEIEFDCNHHSVFENALDMAHIHYLHGDSFGNEGQPQIRDMQTVTDAFSVAATFKLHNKPVNALWEWSKVPEVEVTAAAHLPSTSVISFTLGNGLSFTTFVSTVPVNANKTVNRFALVRNLSWDKSGVFNAGAWDEMARKAMLRILGEDKVMVEKLRPDLLPQEYSVRADLPQIAFRKLRQQYVDLGYAESNELDAQRPPTDL